MPIYTRDDVLDCNNPYTLFADGDALAENQELLDQKFNPSEKQALAINIIFGCDKEQLKAYRHQIKALHSSVALSDSFYMILQQVHEIKSRLEALVDKNNLHPLDSFIDSIAYFKEHDELTLQVLKKEPQSKLFRFIAESLKEKQFSVTKNPYHSLSPKQRKPVENEEEPLNPTRTLTI